MTKNRLENTILFFSKDDFHSLCDKLAKNDKELKEILEMHGYPPMWTRNNTFATLIHIILEQQVSLASALAAFNKLKNKVGKITPQNLLSLSDEEMRACYFSRQKTIYARHLAKMFLSGTINLKKISRHSDDDIRTDLKKVKGIGDWTADIYLLFALQRTDIFPVGDLAMMNALKQIKGLDKSISKEYVLEIAKNWQPYRSIATMLLWHYYIESRKTPIPK